MKVPNLPKLDLNITNRCNFRCTHCAFDSGCKQMTELSLEKLKEILLETKKLGGERIDITGGEPLVREDLYEIIKAGKELNYKIELVTNASLLTNDILEKLKSLGLDAIAISLDGACYKTYSGIRAADEKVYSKVLDNIRESVRYGFYVKINTIAAVSNYKEIPQITRFCIRNGVNEHGIYYFTPVGRGETGGQAAVNPLEWLDFIRKELVPLEKNIKMSVEVPLIERGRLKKEGRCIVESGRSRLHILPDGSVCPCAVLASYSIDIGNARQDHIKRLWLDEGIWDKCWNSVKSLLPKHYGGCVNYGSFGLEGFDKNVYETVCPLRKFSPGDLK